MRPLSSRPGMRLRLAVLALFLLAALAALPARAAGIDPAVVGTWSVPRTIATSGGPTAGTWTIEVAANGTYASIFESPDAFVPQAGFFVVGQGGYLCLATSGEREGAFFQHIEPEQLTIEGNAGREFWLRREPDPRLAALGALLATPMTPTASAWAKRGQDIAALWAPDARLVELTLNWPTRFGLPGGTADPLVMLFYAPSRDRTLAMSPGLMGNVVTRVLPGRTASREGAIPVPILDLTDVLVPARAGGFVRMIERATLGVLGDPGDAHRRLAWMMTAEGNDYAFDVGAMERFDDLKAAEGSPVAFDTVTARAAAAAPELAARVMPEKNSSELFGGATTWSLGEVGGSGMPAAAKEPDIGVFDTAYRRDAALLGALRAADLDAYNRIAAGTPTWDDTNRYGGN